MEYFPSNGMQKLIMYWKLSAVFGDELYIYLFYIWQSQWKNSISTLVLLTVCIFNIRHYAFWISVPWLFCFQYSCLCLSKIVCFLIVLRWTVFVASHLAMYLPKMCPGFSCFPDKLCSLIFLILGTCFEFVAVLGSCMEILRFMEYWEEARFQEFEG